MDRTRQGAINDVDRILMESREKKELVKKFLREFPEHVFRYSPELVSNPDGSISINWDRTEHVYIHVCALTDEVPCIGYEWRCGIEYGEGQAVWSGKLPSGLSDAIYMVLPDNSSILLITEPIQVERAILRWTSTRRRIEHGPWTVKVGELKRYGYSDDSLDFRYDEDLESALGIGFDGYPGVRIGKESSYGTVSMTELFMKRILPPGRRDYDEFLLSFGISMRASLSPLSILAYTEGRSDKDRFQINNTFDGFDEPFRWNFRVWNDNKVPYNLFDLDICEPVYFRYEPDNGVVGVFSSGTSSYKSGVRLGHIDSVYTMNILRWMQRDAIDAQIFSVRDNRIRIVADIVGR